MFHAGPFAAALGWTLLTSLVVLTAAFVLSIVEKRNSVADVAWGLAFVAVAAVAAVLGTGDLARRCLVLAMVAVWGVRLAGFVWWRNRGVGEDARYADMMGRTKGHPVLMAYLKVFALQSVIAWFVAMPVTLSAFQDRGLTALAWVGVVIWAVGVFFEAVGDQQKYVWKKDPANDGQVMDVGLWRYTRHPNYFGDACVWVGIFLVAAEHLPGVATVLSPVVMVFLLVGGSGKALTEKKMAREKPGFAEYKAKTSGFLPLPPRKHVSQEKVEAQKS